MNNRLVKAGWFLKKQITRSQSSVRESTGTESGFNKMLLHNELIDELNNNDNIITILRSEIDML